jgi:hypothetical protein
MGNDVFRKVGDVSNAQSVKDTWKSEISRCRALVDDILEQDKRELMEWLLAKQSYENDDLLAMRSIRKTCNFIG